MEHDGYFYSLTIVRKTAQVMSSEWEGLFGL